MWASFTSGTYHFLKKLTDKHKRFNFYFMRGPSSTLVYYEHKQKRSLFLAGKSYEIIQTSDSLREKGYVTMEHIPVTDDGMKIFEERLQSIFPHLTERNGVTAMRVLKNKKRNEYVVMTQWKNSRYRDLWKDSPFYEEENVQKFVRLSAYFADRPFTNEFYMIEDEDAEKIDFFEEDSD